MLDISAKFAPFPPNIFFASVPVAPACPFPKRDIDGCFNPKPLADVDDSKVVALRVVVVFIMGRK